MTENPSENEKRRIKAEKALEEIQQIGSQEDPTNEFADFRFHPLGPFPRSYDINPAYKEYGRLLRQSRKEEIARDLEKEKRKGQLNKLGLKAEDKETKLIPEDSKKIEHERDLENKQAP